MKKPFLEEVADYLLKHYSDDLENVTVVFPNKRSGLFLKKYLSQKIKKPVWMPRTESIQDFLCQFSSIHEVDSLELIFDLYQSFTSFDTQETTFESFYAWGDMLLKDFQEIDNYLIEPQHLFKYIKDDKQLAEEFYFLEEEQEQLIKQFWATFVPKSSNQQKEFVKTWQILLPIYEDFKSKLKQRNIGYLSHIYRQLASNLDTAPLLPKGSVVFAGFNALTPCEERLIKHFIREHKAAILWDVDVRYFEDSGQEGGMFIRNYQKDNLFKPSFREINLTKNAPKEIEVVGVVLEVGQAKFIGNKIQEILHSKEAKEEEIAIVLPQEYMLFPLLNSLPPEVKKLNVTMGYPMKETTLYSLLLTCIDLQSDIQVSSEGELHFYHEFVIDILTSQYLYGVDDSFGQYIGEIKKNNMVRVPNHIFNENPSLLLSAIFIDSASSADKLVGYLTKIIDILFDKVEKRFGLELEFLHQYQLILSRLHEILKKYHHSIDIRLFKKLFQKVSSTMRIPFTGEPLEGLQVLGVLESRNLHFKYVFLLSMNEGIFPTSVRKGSFIPYAIRKSFDLPTHEYNDAIYAYLFFRLIEQSKSICCLYNTYADFGLSGEVTRFIRQLDWESEHTIHWKKLHNTIRLDQKEGIVIQKNADVFNRLKQYTSEGYSGLSPSALNTYIDCKLKFYFRYVLRLFSEDTMNAELSAGDVGNIIHRALEVLYKEVVPVDGIRKISQNDFFMLKNSVDGAIDKTFRTYHGLSKKKKFLFTGRNVIMKSVIKKYIRRVLEIDETNAPFLIIGLEKNVNKLFTIQSHEKKHQIRVKGLIDRVDQVNETIRLVDYKTGSDTSKFKDIESLFYENINRNKAVFQTFFYAWLYQLQSNDATKTMPALFNMKEIFMPNFDVRLEGANQLLDKVTDEMYHVFETQLTTLLTSIFDEEIPFDQTIGKQCTWCDFKSICRV